MKLIFSDGSALQSLLVNYFARIFLVEKLETTLCFDSEVAIGIGHFRVPKNLTFKARLSAKPLIWKWFLIMMQIKLIFTTKVSHLASFWKWDFLELGNGLLNTLLNNIEKTCKGGVCLATEEFFIYYKTCERSAVVCWITMSTLIKGFSHQIDWLGKFALSSLLSFNVAFKINE